MAHFIIRKPLLTEKGTDDRARRNAHTGTGAELMDDEKVVALYMGTLARSLQKHDAAETEEARDDVPGPDQ